MLPSVAIQLLAIMTVMVIGDQKQRMGMGYSGTQVQEVGTLSRPRRTTRTMRALAAERLANQCGVYNLGMPTIARQQCCSRMYGCDGLMDTATISSTLGPWCGLLSRPNRPRALRAARRDVFKVLPPSSTALVHQRSYVLAGSGTYFFGARLCR